MTVTTDRVSQGIVGNGADTVFDFTIPYQSYTTLYAYRQIGTAMTLLRHSVDYTMVATTSPQITVTLLIGGTSVFANPPDALTTIWVVRDTPIVQSAYDLVATSPWVPIPTEAAFDAVYLILQELDDKVSNAITIGGPPGGIILTPDPNKYLKWDATGTNIIAGSLTDAQITSIETRLTAVEGSLNGIQTELDAFELSTINNLNNLQAQITSNDADILALQNTVTSHGIRLNNIEADIAALPPNQAADILDLQNRMVVVEADMTIAQDDITLLQDQVAVLDERMDKLEATNFTYRRTGRFVLVDPVYPTDTLIFGLEFDFDFTSSSILNIEIRRASIGDERVETYIYSAVWANGVWGVVIVSADIQTAPTGVNIVLVQDIVDRAVQLYFNAPVALPGTYDKDNSWIVWTTEDMVRSI